MQIGEMSRGRLSMITKAAKTLEANAVDLLSQIENLGSLVDAYELKDAKTAALDVKRNIAHFRDRAERLGNLAEDAENRPEKKVADRG